MPGAVAFNARQGSRSEVLADYLFSQWGTVNPVRWSDDYGGDLYCTLSERIGLRGVVREYFTVQVKSNLDPWVFPDQQSVRWLVEYPTPLLFAVVDKKQQLVRVYHVMPRFCVWALGVLPNYLELTPEDIEDGSFVEWTNGTAFSLSAPIIRASLADLMDDEKVQTLGKVLESWVRFDRENCDLVRFGLARFRMPTPYRVNDLPGFSGGIGELGLTQPPEPAFLNRGIASLAEGAECIGGQLDRLGDRSGALRAALLVRYLLQEYPNVFGNIPRWQGNSIPGDLGARVCQRLNSTADEMGVSQTYYNRGIDEVAKALDNDPLVKRFIGADKSS